jgi:hypothetical protein
MLVDNYFSGWRTAALYGFDTPGERGRANAAGGDAGSGQQAEDGGLFVQVGAAGGGGLVGFAGRVGLVGFAGRVGLVGRRQLLPLCDSKGADIFSGAGEVGGDAEAGGGAAGRQHGFEQLVIPIRGFDKELGTVEARGFSLQIFERCGTAGIINGQVAGKAELLAVQTAGHEREQDGTGPDEGTHDGAGLMGDGGQQLTGIGDAGAACLADETDGLARTEGGAKDSRYFFFRLVDGVPFIVINHHFFPEGFQVAAGAAFVFDEEDLALFYRVEDIRRQRGADLFFEPAGNEVESGSREASGRGVGRWGGGMGRHGYSRFW